MAARGICNRRLRFLGSLAVLALLAAASPAQTERSKKKAGKAATPAAAPPLSASPGYRLGAGDVLQIVVFKEPDASVPEVAVRPDGKISVPFLGEIEVQGLTPSELEKSFTQRLIPFIKEPEVSVIVKSVQSQKIYVIGQVKKGGPIALTGSMTVLEALSQAELDDFAKKNGIYVLRSQGKDAIKLPFKYNDVIQGKHPEQNVVLQPGDTVVVP